MANLPANSTALVVSGSGNITGSFTGFTVVQQALFTGLRDANNTVLASATAPLAFAAGTNVPLFVTSASIASGSVLFY